MAGRQPVLLERDAERAVFADVIGRVASGAGCVLAIEGAAGIGKTSLLHETARLAAAEGLHVLRARGGELERELAFGVVRQLFERAVATAPAARQHKLLAGAAALARGPLTVAGDDDPSRVDASAALHGLYWLLVNLSDAGPVLLVVDDVQWSDVESLHWLTYLARRIDELPVGVAVALRTGEAGGPTGRPDLLRELLAEPATRTVRLGPLELGSVASLIEDAGGAPANAGVARTVLGLTGGNPFALTALLAAVRDDGIDLAEADAERLEQLGGTAIADTLLARVARLGPDACAIAQAIAVLGAGSGVRDAAQLAELSEARAASAADALRRVGIVQPAAELEFDHPLTRAAVYTSIATSTRAQMHTRAARLLAERFADADHVAAQLLAGEPAGDPWVVDRLRDAARRAAAVGASDSAVAYLRRALREPPAAGARAATLHELGAAEIATGSPDGETHLRQSLALAPSVPVALDLAMLLSHSNRPSLGGAVLADALDQLGDSDRELRLYGESALCGIGLLDLATRAHASERLARQAPVSGETPGERALLATRSIEAVMDGDSAEATAARALAALGGGRLLRETGSDSQLVYLAANALVLCDRLAEALEELDAAVEDAGRRGSVMGFVLATCWRSNALLKAGRVADAEADARASIDAAGRAGLGMLAHFALAFLLDALLELGRADEAAAEVERSGVAGELPDLHHYTTLLDSRGRVRVARGDVPGGLADALECGRQQLAWSYPNPAPLAWRSNAARAHALLGAPADAVALAQDELELARRFGAPRPIAVALRALAAVGEADARAARLAEAERTVRDGDARLEHAHALVELGAELRRRNQRGEARELLQAGWDAAERCGAAALSSTATDELAAAGGRRRRGATSGVEALTASERRVAQLASRGASNPEIAQVLFVTRATVESHLHAAYGKLGISSRTQLAEALAGAHRSGATRPVS